MARIIRRESQCWSIQHEIFKYPLLIDSHARYLITKLRVEHTIFYVINVYAPNDYREQEQFIRILGEKLVSKTDTTKLIISGDWDATLNKTDKWGRLPWKETTCRNSLLTWWKNSIY